MKPKNNKKKPKTTFFKLLGYKNGCPMCRSDSDIRFLFPTE